MTAPTIDQAFITQFESDVHVAYQRQGSKLRGTVRSKTFGPAEKQRFQRYGKGGKPSTKARHAEITPQDGVHDYVDLTVADYYNGEYVDSLDLLKTNIDERTLVANAQAYSHGRNTDDILFTEFAKAANALGASGGGARKYAAGALQTMATAIALAVMEDFNTNDVPDDGRRFVQVHPKVWTKLMGLQEFTRMEWLPNEQLPYQGGMMAKQWLGFIWLPHSGCPTDGNGDVKTFFYHQSALGHGVLQDMKTDVTWQGTRQAWFIASSMSQGAVMIDNTGTLEVLIDV